MRDREPPSGYAQFDVPGARVVCIESIAASLRVALRDATLYDFAAKQSNARALAGRGTSYAIQLPKSAERVVVRHNRHGGMLARLTGDLFRAPTRAPVELEISERLRSVNVPTPKILGYIAYPAVAGFERVDVISREIPDSHDLSTALMSTDATERSEALRATAELIMRLSDAGARHHDLNIKNVLLQPDSDGPIPHAFVLDVDRVTFGLERTAAIDANLARLVRSARKWQSLHRARVTDAELESLGAMMKSSTRT
jgi:hypothetical protein